jgi:hypothetical protein
VKVKKRLLPSDPVKRLFFARAGMLVVIGIVFMEC